MILDDIIDSIELDVKNKKQKEFLKSMLRKYFLSSYYLVSNDDKYFFNNIVPVFLSNGDYTLEDDFTEWFFKLGNKQMVGLGTPINNCNLFQYHKENILNSIKTLRYYIALFKFNNLPFDVLFYTNDSDYFLGDEEKRITSFMIYTTNIGSLESNNTFLWRYSPFVILPIKKINKIEYNYLDFLKELDTEIQYIKSPLDLENIKMTSKEKDINLEYNYKYKGLKYDKLL